MRITALALKMNLADGGGSNYALDTQLRHLVERGHAVRLITLFPKNNKFPEDPPYSIIEQYSCGGEFLSLQNCVRETMKKEEDNTDIFYLDGQSLLWGGGEYRDKGKNPVAAYVNCYTRGMNLTHDDSEKQNRFFSRASSRLYGWKRFLWEKIFGIKRANKIDLIIMNSPVIREHYVRYGLNPKKIIVLPLEMQFKTPETETPKDPPFQKKEKIIDLLYAGRLIYDKGIDILIEALKEHDTDMFRLHIAGEGPQKQNLIDLVKKYEIVEKIFFYPWVPASELSKFYAAADVFVHPCRLPEPFGRTVAEAMMQGKPVVTAAGSGAAWIAGDTGKTFIAGDSSDLKRALFYFSDPEIIREYGARAKTRAREFDFKNFAPQFEAALENLVHIYPADNSGSSE